ncbi:MAG: lytic murein transglycosylase [Candidatus Rokubacteria bacterium]|nr:lytic murein transglycosylase [Candidatus Rokubacteria bacterium]
MRGRWLLTVALVLGLVSAAAARSQQPFDEWLAELVAEARTKGYADELLTKTLAGLTPLPGVIASDRRQPEAMLPFEEYIRRRVTPERIQRARELAEQHRALLDRVREAYGVPPAIIVSIWGLESRFGERSGDIPVFQALATLAWEGRRAAFFRGQLYEAIAMVDRGYIDAASMKGSWAGAMGQPQFMPSSYLAWAVDFDGDGRRDIWASAADTFASIANYLAGHGWKAGEPWGHEVQTSPGSEQRAARAFGRRESGCRAMREMIGPARRAEWSRLGVRRTESEDPPKPVETVSSAKTVPTAALVRAGDRRFLVHGNYDAILRYNCSHHYALSVTLLADRIE